MKQFKLIVLSLVILSLFIFGCSKQNTVPTQTQVPNQPTENNPTIPTQQSTNMIEIKDMSFNPNTLNVKQGETVTWTNQDSTIHTVQFDDNSFASDELSKQDSVSFTFDKKGTFTYHCGVHPSMKGTIIVE